MLIANKSNATKFSEWESFYLNSGEERKELLKEYLPKEDFKKVNTEYGRTKKDLIKIAKDFNKHLNLPLKTVYNYVYIRVIDESWIGYKRELKAFEVLKEECSCYNGIEVCKTEFKKDKDYSIDFEIKKDNKVILGIQLKSITYYLSSSKGNLDAKEVNSIKQKKYKNEFKTPVLNLYIASKEGRIVNIKTLRKYLKDNAY